MHQHDTPTSDHHPDPATPQVPPPSSMGDIFDEGQTFEHLGLRSSVLKGVQAAGFTRPTHIQAQLIPVMLRAKDVLGQAKTGSGKTAAFGLPVVHMCNKDAQYQALVLAPTRELAVQITEEINELAKFTPIRAVTVFGGQGIAAQARNLQSAAHIIVATPGRLMDMHERGHIHFTNVRFVVLDEVDRMLDIGFRDDIRKILDKCPPPVEHPGGPGRQTIMVSATISDEIERLARRYMRDPEKVVTAAGSLTVSMVEQRYLTVEGWDKERLLVHLLTHEEPALTVVFCRLKRTVDKLAKRLKDAGIDVRAIHGDMPQGKRNKVMEHLRGGQLSVLIASDLAARGIDVEGISHVINYDLPEDPEVYVHRIGRTARAGRKGIAWSLVTPSQGELLSAIEDLINKEIPKMEYPDFKPSPKPESYRDPDQRHAGGFVLASAPAGQPAAPKVNRVQASVNPEVPSKAAADPTKFPGGIVPTQLPPKRLMGRIKGGKR
ncbi:MAG: DEAD/DEAH box helicase [Phycisphaeraceae bacterium]|nr:MAG: DEAD/DEAH box helicase [Phycisphaeraceae bacterium]